MMNKSELELELSKDILLNKELEQSKVLNKVNTKKEYKGAIPYWKILLDSEDSSTLALLPLLAY
jgi:hypothetical protein